MCEISHIIGSIKKIKIDNLKKYPEKRKNILTKQIIN